MARKIPEQKNSIHLFSSQAIWALLLKTLLKVGQNQNFHQQFAAIRYFLLGKMIWNL